MRLAVGGAPNFTTYDEAGEAPAELARVVTKATDPLLLCFTSGTMTKPKLVLHTHQSYPVRRDDAGYIHFVDRGDDVFKTSDDRISPFELESVLIDEHWLEGTK